MAKNSSKVNFNTVNEAYGVNTPGEALVFAIGPTQFGKTYNPEEIITNPAQFKKRFGNPFSGNSFPMYALRLLDRGIKLRVCRIPLVGAQFAETEWITDDDTPANNLFKLKAIGSGDYYNDLTFNLTVDNTYTGVGTKFTLVIKLLGVTKETFTVVVPDWSISADQGYMDEVIDNSEFISVEYASSQTFSTEVVLSDIVGGTFTGGVNGIGVSLSDYETGLSAFNAYDDGIIIVAPQSTGVDSNDILLTNVLGDYASLRKDLVAIAPVPFSLTDTADVLDYVDLLTLPTEPKFLVLSYGGGKVITDGVVSTISEIADVVALVANLYNSTPWLSPSGPTQGLLGGLQGVYNNLGTNASDANRELVTNAGVNPVIKRNGQVMLWNAYTMADEASQEKFLSVVLLEIYIKKVLIPTVEKFLSKPNEFETWSALYYNVKPFLDGLVTKRAFFSYEWKGDQFASSLSDLQVNDPADIQDGKYKAILEAKLVSPIVTITIEFYKQSLSIT